MLALIVASIGFIAKLFAEAIEEISLKQVEAVRATGALVHVDPDHTACMPQVLSRFIGFATYQLDSNLRNSTMVGIVGAGGIGGTLFAAFQRFDYDFVLAILIVIIALIMVAEIVSGWAREGVPMSAAAVRRRRPPRRLAALHAAKRLARFALHPVRRGRRSWSSLRTIEIIPEFLYDAPEQMADLFDRMWPIGSGLLSPTAARALVETLHIATLGTLLALVMAVPVGLAGGAQRDAQLGPQPAGEVRPRVVALGQFAGLGAAVRGGLRARARSPARWRSRSARSASSASSSPRRWRRPTAARSRRCRPPGARGGSRACCSATGRR